MDPNSALPDFAFIDPKLLAQFIALILLWVQFTKEYIPDGYVKLYSIASALFFTALVDSCMEGGCSKIIPPGVARGILYAVMASSAAGVGFKAMTSKNGKGAKP